MPLQFIVGGVIRRLQDADAGLPSKKFAFLFHTNRNARLMLQEQIVQAVRDQLMAAAANNPVA